MLCDAVQPDKIQISIYSNTFYVDMIAIVPQSSCGTVFRPGFLTETAVFFVDPSIDTNLVYALPTELRPFKP